VSRLALRPTQHTIQWVHKCREHEIIFVEKIDIINLRGVDIDHGFDDIDESSVSDHRELYEVSE
jgi:hypothetical protein